jgi:Flp pilus assembly protein TadG
MSSRRSGRREERGAVALIAGLVSLALLIVAALTVDIGSTWARRGELQRQADHAALFAAESLPAYDASSRLAVAQQVAYYLCRHLVAGQQELTPSIPSCDDTTSPTSATVTTFASYLLAQGWVTFPETDQVYVRTPPARIDYSFGRAAGVDGSTQWKEATARVASPGLVEPVGLSLTCLLSAAGNLPSGGTLTDVVPLNYITAGPLTTSSAPNAWPVGEQESSGITISSMTPNQTTQGVNTSFVLLGSGWLAGTVRLSFMLGDGSDPAATSQYTRVDQDYTGVLGSITGASLPATVVDTPGTWDVKVGVQNPDGTYTYSAAAYSFTVTMPQGSADLLGCARLLKSPRGNQDDDASGSRRLLEHNLQEGLDHGLVKYPNLLSVGLPSPLTASDLLAALQGGLTQCPGSSPAVADTAVNVAGGQPPNCMIYHNGPSVGSEFTAGMLGPPSTVTLPDGTSKQVGGRLVCTSSSPCRHGTISAASLGLPGSYDVNDDHFEDYVDPAKLSLLTTQSFFNLSTYVTDGIPVATPRDALVPEIYSSQRFFWVPVLSTVLPLDGTNTGPYPTLTFRPVFVTQNAPSGIASVDMVLDIVDSTVRSLLGIDPTSDHGIVMNGGQLRALRFMTIEPASLPQVPADYNGPMSDYLGVGPKIIRLVK